MRQDVTISRRKAVALVAGTLGAWAVPAADDAALAHTSDVADLAQSRRLMLEALQNVRRARGTALRAQAFRRFAKAARVHDAAETAFVTSQPPARTLYHQREPEAVLARVIVRELEASPHGEAAWMARFADLEAVIHARTLLA